MLPTFLILLFEMTFPGVPWRFSTCQLWFGEQHRK